MNVQITLSLPLELLTDIENNVKGKSRAEKVRRCLQTGYKHHQKASR